MPIYEETYHAWNGQLVANPRTWWVIAKTGVRLAWKRIMVWLLILSSLPFLFGAGQIYVSTRLAETIPIGDMPIQEMPIAEAALQFQIDPQFFSDFLQGQALFLFFILIVAGAGLIANDRKLKALAIYFSKPLGFWDYTAGKLLVVGAYGGLVTIVPALLLFLMKVLLSQDATFLETYYWIPFSILGQSLVALLVLGGAMLALSAVASGGRAAALLFFGLLTLPDIFPQIIPGVPELGLLSIGANLGQVTAMLFGVDRPHDYSAWLALIALAAVVAAAVGVLKLKIRPTEVVR